MYIAAYVLYISLLLVGAFVDINNYAVNFICLLDNVFKRLRSRICIAHTLIYRRCGTFNRL